MTKNEFMNHLAREPRWSPGWDAIEEEFRRLYPAAVPEHLATVIAARAAFGGDQYLDGYSFYASPKGYLHLVTFGLSELYGNKRAFGGAWSGRGCELTMKVRETIASEALWACDILSAIAKFACGRKIHLAPYQLLTEEELGLSSRSGSDVQAVLLIPDTEARPLRTIYGKVQFLQVLGLTGKQAAALLSGDSVEENFKKYMLPHLGSGLF